MKALVTFIETLIAETIAAGGNVQDLFTLKIPKKGYSRKWLFKALEKRGPGLLTSQAWVCPIPNLLSKELPPIATVGDLAAYLNLGITELEWFADLQQRNAAKDPLQHYLYRWIPRRKGPPRLLMEPKDSLKITQRRLLNTIVNAIPLHDSAHGFVQGRSIKTFASEHTNQKAVLRMDLADFFPSILFSRVAGMFRAFGYRPKLANLLAGLCTHQPPRSVARMNRHLPQGAPTSPCISNIIAYRLDCRLAGLANSQNLTYSRYADDLVFSGERIRESFSHLVSVIILEEGFSVHHRKTRLMKSSTKQQIAGVIVNKHPNIDRREFDRLKAILHNCAQKGPSSQGMSDQSRQLRGKISYVQMLNPQRGEKLLKMYEAINWD